jgi:formate hydrogenlyase transcriptional activator
VLNQIAALMAMAVDHAAVYEEIARLKDRLAKEKLYLEDEIRSEHNFGEVVGNSSALCHVLKQVEIAAPSDATVLVLGETGTGKELVARALHRLSSRRDGNFIKLNCAAIPTGLLESELFGHEKGAFTGAISQKIGRLELADKGTLFLDEIGEIPLELQPKLLRVLQDQEFERLGAVRTIKVNVRVIAATNRDLHKAVDDHQFRRDLFYRLNVFPIRLPALRDRAGDIPLLVRYFVQKFARRMGKSIESIPADLVQELERWHWPGNIRELENFLERSVILTQGTVLYAPMAELRMALPGRNKTGTLQDVEREHILRILREAGGAIAGVTGAAARLGMKRSTLQSRMQKLGITREHYAG